MISTHTPLAGRDALIYVIFNSVKISTHTPLAGRDKKRLRAAVQSFRFLLTRPSRGATYRLLNWVARRLFLLTRPSRGATDNLAFQPDNIVFLLTRPSRGATPDRINTRWITKFLLTRPSRGATTVPEGYHDGSGISTHTPLAGRDGKRISVDVNDVNFYSHAPRGARQLVESFGRDGTKFLLTRPSRGATKPSFNDLIIIIISTHTPLAGRDKQHSRKTGWNQYFYSHAPRGARRHPFLVCV